MRPMPIVNGYHCISILRKGYVCTFTLSTAVAAACALLSLEGLVAVLAVPHACVARADWMRTLD